MSEYTSLKFSFVIVCLNSAKTIEKTLQSVYSQTYPNIEIVVIDGLSTDGTVDIIKKHSDKITYWVSEKDRCVSHGVNKGIEAATGDVIYCLPSDDFIEPDFCQKMANAFLQSGHHVDFVYGDVLMFDQNGTPLFKYLKRRISFFGVRKEVYQDIGYYDENMKLNNDIDFLQRMDNAQKVGVYCGATKWMRMGGATQQNLLYWMKSLKKLEREQGENLLVVNIRFLYRFLLYFSEALIQKWFGTKGFLWFMGLRLKIKKLLGKDICYIDMKVRKN